MAGTLQKLAQWHARIDAQVQPFVERHAGRLQCRKGCSQCCVDEISVFPIEAERIRDRHADLLRSGVPHPEGACAFLDHTGACRIYEDRPYVCRTQGLPLRWYDETERGERVELRDICPLNELDETPVEQIPPEDCWLIGPAEQHLAELQAAFDPQRPRARVPLRSLFMLSATRQSDPEVADADHPLQDPPDTKSTQARPAPARKRRGPPNMVVLALVSEAILAAIAVVLGYAFGKMPWTTLSFSLGDLFVGIAATIPPLGALWLSENSDFAPLRELGVLVRERIAPLFRDTSLLGLAVIALSAGIGEELLFRGAVQALVGDWLGPWTGLVVASVVFGLAHPISRVYVIAVTVIGLYLGVLWMVTGNLLVPIVVHALYDLIALYVFRDMALERAGLR